MKIFKGLERYSKKIIRNLLKKALKSERLPVDEVDTGSLSKILVVRQDSRLGNLILMTPLLSALKAVLPDAEVDVLVAEGFEDILAENPNVNRFVIFKKQKARLIPWSYFGFIRKLKNARYDLAIDVSDGCHFSLNNVLLTFFSGARYRLGYDRENAGTFMNIIIPPPPENTPMAEAMQRIIEPILPGIRKYQTAFYVGDHDRSFAGEWLQNHSIAETDSFVVMHPGGKGKKRWSIENFADLIDRIAATGEKVVVIGGKSEQKTLFSLRTLAHAEFDILERVSVGQMAAIIERARLFVSGDTGPMHVAEALGKPVVAIFLASNAQVYGHHGKKTRVVTGNEGSITAEEVFSAVQNLSGQ
ncbi:MAG: glycosyltransferase family 9 protein [Candidatus Latescibacterota bacterium]